MSVNRGTRFLEILIRSGGKFGKAPGKAPSPSKAPARPATPNQASVKPGSKAQPKACPNRRPIVCPWVWRLRLGCLIPRGGSLGKAPAQAASPCKAPAWPATPSQASVEPRPKAQPKPFSSRRPMAVKTAARQYRSLERAWHNAQTSHAKPGKYSQRDLESLGFR